MVQVPYSTAAYTITYSGYSVVYSTAFGLVVTFDGVWCTKVTVPSLYANKLAGLCGNYDGMPLNDLTLANGTYVGTWTNGAQVFGDSYIVYDPETGTNTSYVVQYNNYIC